MINGTDKRTILISFHGNQHLGQRWISWHFCPFEPTTACRYQWSVLVSSSTYSESIQYSRKCSHTHSSLRFLSTVSYYWRVWVTIIPEHYYCIENLLISEPQKIDHSDLAMTTQGLQSTLIYNTISYFSNRNCAFRVSSAFNLVLRWKFQAFLFVYPFNSHCLVSLANVIF